jgi:hypothetical protein
MEKSTRNMLIIGTGVLVLAGLGYFIYTKVKDEPKGEGEVSANAKSDNKITFVRKK